MIEQVFTFCPAKNKTQPSEKSINKLIFDENIHYIHMVFPEQEGLPEHNANANVYMTVVSGILSISLDDQATHEYSAGSVLKIPTHTKMNVRNLHEELLELIVIKAPAPIN